jgi:hypothetical protein
MAVIRSPSSSSSSRTPKFQQSGIFSDTLILPSDVGKQISSLRVGGGGDCFGHCNADTAEIGEIGGDWYCARGNAEEAGTVAGECCGAVIIIIV